MTITTYRVPIKTIASILSGFSFANRPLTQSDIEGLDFNTSSSVLTISLRPVGTHFLKTRESYPFTRAQVANGYLQYSGSSILSTSITNVTGDQDDNSYAEIFL